MFVFLLDWTEFAKGIVQILGVIAAAAIGAQVASKNVVKQLIYNNQTRFHEKRYELYSDFMNTSDQLITKIYVAYKLPEARDNPDRSYKIIEKMSRANQLYMQIRMVCSKEVLNEAGNIHVFVSKAYSSYVDRAELDVSQLIRDLQKMIFDFSDITRKEINSEIS